LTLSSSRVVTRNLVGASLVTTGASISASHAPRFDLATSFPERAVTIVSQLLHLAAFECCRFYALKSSRP
jgi:hypothetical protein